MKVLSLFSGVGGFDYGLENAGMQTVFQCEIDKHCTKILERHWPNVPRWQDVQTLTGDYVLSKAEEVDVVAWGSPCQDLSIAGKRAGLVGANSNLFHEGIRIIKEMRQASGGQYPRISIWENVMGALNSNKGADFGRVIDEMAEAGALVIEWRCLDAKYFGVPQRRRRVFVVAVFDPAIARDCRNPILPITKSVCWYSKKSAAKNQSITSEAGTSIDSASPKPIYLDRSAYNSGVNAKFASYISDAPTIPPLTAQGPGVVATDQDCIAFSHTQGLDAQPSEQFWPTLRTEGQGHAVYAASNEHERTYRQVTGALLKRDCFSPNTEGVRDGKLILELTENEDNKSASRITIRRLTPVECERLMGWPDDWTSGQTDGHRYRQCGNGVASPVAEWIGEQVMNIRASDEPTQQ